MAILATGPTDNMVSIGGGVMMDAYEASVWSATSCEASTQYTTSYPAGFPANVESTGCTTATQCATEARALTAQSTAVYACSVPSVAPATTLTWYQAKKACENGGKRLCTRAEWQRGCKTDGEFFTGVSYSDGTCNDKSVGAIANAGATTTCTNTAGFYDVLGNVMEWTNDCAGGVCAAKGGGYLSRTYAGIGVWALACTQQNLELMFGPFTTGADRGFRCCL